MLHWNDATLCFLHFSHWYLDSSRSQIGLLLPPPGYGRQLLLPFWFICLGLTNINTCTRNSPLLRGRRCLEVFHFPARYPPSPNLIQWIDASPQPSHLGLFLTFTPPCKTITSQPTATQILRRMMFSKFIFGLYLVWFSNLSVKLIFIQSTSGCHPLPMFLSFNQLNSVNHSP